MKTVFVLGLRGFPDVPGGIETHCQNLYRLIASKDLNVVILCRSPYQKLKGSWSENCNVSFLPIWSPVGSGLETIVHTFLGVLYALVMRPEIVHLHAIGPSLFAPLLRLFRIKVVCTHHGFDYEREKWGLWAALLLRVGEYLGVRFSNEYIAVSKLAKARLELKYGRTIHCISNGVEFSTHQSINYLSKWGVEEHAYFLSVSRVVEEKRQLDVLKAYQLLEKRKCKLVFVGASGGGDYYDRLKQAAAGNQDVVFTGSLSGAELASVFSYARAFIHASSLEGNPIVLLEAMSYGLPIVASNIAANLELALDSEDYFEMGDIKQLSQKMGVLQDANFAIDERKIARIRIEFSWNAKAKDTLNVYNLL